MWISHAWSLGILSAPCGTFLPMMKCYCCQCQTFSLYQFPSWQPSLFRQTWDNFKVRTFNTRSSGPNFFPIHCSTISFPFHHDSQNRPSSWKTAAGGMQWSRHSVWTLESSKERNLHNFSLLSSLETWIMPLNADTYFFPQNSRRDSIMH